MTKLAARLAMEDEIHCEKTVTVAQRKGGCGIHQTVTTTLVQTYPADHEKLMALIAVALRETDGGGDYNSVAEQVSAIEAVVAQIKGTDAAMSCERNRVEKLESELAELKRELERYKLESWGKTLISMVAGALLPGGIMSKLRGVRDLLSLVLGD